MGIYAIIATASSGLMAGLFFSFSTAVMPGLADLPADRARAAMRRINVRIQNPLFLAVFIGNALLCLVEVAFDGRYVGGLLYVFGGFLLTMVVHVPMNNRLERTDDAYWLEYLRRWTFWNHVRTAACFASAVILPLGF